MGENIVSSDKFIIPNFKQELQNFAGVCFDQEKNFYAKLYDGTGGTPGDVTQLNAKKCAELYEKVVEKLGEGAKEFIEILRDRDFYEDIRQKVTNNLNTNYEKIFNINVNNKNINIEDVTIFQLPNDFKTQVNSFLSQYDEDKRLRRSTVNNILNTLENANENEEKIKKALEKIKIKKMIQVGYTNEGGFYLSLKRENEDKKDEKELKFEFRKSKTGTSTILWDQKDAKQLSNFLEQAYGMIINEPKFVYKIMNDIVEINEDYLDKFINNFINFIKEDFLKRHKRKYAKKFTTDTEMQEIKNKIENLLNSTVKEKIRQIIQDEANSEDFKDLLQGEKTSKKISGDLGEAITGLLITTLMNQNAEFFGDTQTGFGQAAVDLYVKQMGFQVKNYPTKEQDDIITLYEDTKSDLTIRDKNGKINIADTDRYLTFSEKEEICNEFQYEKIKSIIQKEFPKFVRYSQNFKKTENAKEEIISNLKEKYNNFYILNFRIIPASRIFYEMSLIVPDNNNNNQLTAIDQLFYISEEEMEDTEKIDKNLLSESMRDFPEGIKETTASIFFKGIPINYSALKESKNSNLLSIVFK